jgi:hypothetical protein
MKKQWRWLLLAIFALLCLPELRAQEEEILRENVSVINTEVPVRVVFKGQAVTDLKKEDFFIYEGGRLQKINGFQLVRKKIAGSEGASAGPGLHASRYFVLVFKVFEFNDALRDGLAYAFDRILSPQDQLLVLINDKIRVYPNLAEADKIRSEIEADLRDQCHRAHNAMLAFLRELDELVMTTRNAYESHNIWESRPTFIRNFLQKYQEMLALFKNRFMTQDFDNYYNFARHLEKVRKEKWVINFFQLEILPRLKPNGEMMDIVREVRSECEESLIPEYKGFYVIITQLLQSIENESKTSVEFPVEEISKLFLKVNATFHTIFLDARMDFDGKNLELLQIASGKQNNLRDLTEKTGGKLVASTDMVSSLETIAAAEDIYYMLTYSPDNPAKIGKIKVKTANKKYDVLYDDNLRADYIKDYLSQKEKENPSVKIKGLAVDEKKLSFTLQDYALAKAKDETCGWLKIHVVVQNADKQVFFNQAKVLKAGSRTFSLSLDFPFLRPGRYDFIVEVLDQVSGKTSTEVIQPLIK